MQGASSTARGLGARGLEAVMHSVCVPRQSHMPEWVTLLPHASCLKPVHTWNGGSKTISQTTTVVAPNMMQYDLPDRTRLVT